VRVDDVKRAARALPLQCTLLPVAVQRTLPLPDAVTRCHATHTEAAALSPLLLLRYATPIRAVYDYAYYLAAARRHDDAIALPPPATPAPCLLMPLPHITPLRHTLFSPLSYLRLFFCRYAIFYTRYAMAYYAERHTPFSPLRFH